MKYTMIYDGDSFIDGIDYDSIESAIASAEDTLCEWLCEGMHDWKFDDNGIPQPTEEQIEEWNYMIENCSVWVVPKGKDYDDAVWTMSDELCDQIGWLCWEDLVKKMNIKEG